MKKRGKTIYPLAIQVMYEAESRDWCLGYYSKGEHDAAFFATILREDWGVAGATESAVRFDWWRVVPYGGGGCVFVPAEPNSRGAFPVTVFDVVNP